MLKKIKEFLNHPYWKFPVWEPLGVLVGIIAIVITYAIFLRSQEVKNIQIVTLTDTSLVDISNLVQSQISISYSGRNIAITNLSLVQVKVENSGTIPITIQDFAEPINFVFPRGADVLDARVVEKSPRYLDVNLSVHDDSSVIISPLLLNPSDKIVIQFVVANIPVINKNDCYGWQANRGYGYIDIATEVAATQQAFYYPTISTPEDSSILSAETPPPWRIDTCIPTSPIPTYQIVSRIVGVSDLSPETAISEQAIVTHNITISFVFLFCLVLIFAISWTHWRNTNDNLPSSIWKSIWIIFICLILAMILLGCLLLVLFFYRL
jgi:hypothetical protein